MQTAGPVASPDKTRFGLGFQIAEHRGARFTGHGGGDRGVDNYFAWYPEHRLSIAVLCNTDNTGSWQITQRIADAFIPTPSAEPAAASAAAPAPAITLSSEQLEGKAGLYREAGGDMFVRSFVRDGELRLAQGTGTGESFALTPASDARFTIAGSSFVFEFTPSGAARAKTLRAFDGQTMSGTFERVEGFSPSPAQLRDDWVYSSDELDVIWTLVVRDSALVITRIGNADTVVEPLATDMFTTIGDFMRFSRDARGAITGVTLVSSGARGLRFTRVRG